MEVGDYEFIVDGKFTSDAGDIYSSYTFTLTVTKSCQTAVMTYLSLDSATVNYDSTASINASVLFSSDVAGCTITYSCNYISPTATSPAPVIDCASSLFTIGSSDGLVTIQPGIDRTAMPADIYDYVVTATITESGAN